MISRAGHGILCHCRPGLSIALHGQAIVIPILAYQAQRGFKPGFTGDFHYARIGGYDMSGSDNSMRGADNAGK